MNESIPGLPSRRGPGLGTTILVAGLTSALVAVLTVVVMERVRGSGGLGGGAAGGGEGDVQGGDVVEVPSVVNMPPDTARELLDGRGLLMVIKGERPDPEVPAGWIVEQTPMEGSRVRRGSEVEAKVSSGAERVTVPSIVGRPVTEARATIEEVGLRVGQVQETGTGTAGTVTATSPAPGTRVAKGTEVLLTSVPATVEPELVEVPPLRRKSLSSARRALEEVGLRVGRRRETYDDNLPPRVVIRSRPSAGERVPPGTEVDLVINEGD